MTASYNTYNTYDRHPVYRTSDVSYHTSIYTTSRGGRGRRICRSEQSASAAARSSRTAGTAGKNRSFRLQKILLFLVFSLFITFFCGITFGSILSNAQSTEEKALDTFKYYKSITVESGDSLWSIAQEHMTEEYSSVNDYIEEVCFINSLTDTTIHAGKSLTIPYYSTVFQP